MSNIVTVIADDSGLNGRMVNPYELFISEVVSPPSKWEQFESTVKTYPFTKQVEPGVVVQCREVKQVKGLNQNRWLTLSQNESEQSYYGNKMHFETRIAYSPIEQPKEEKKEIGKRLSDEYLKSLKFHDKYFSNESWHPDVMDIKDMGEEAYNESMAEYDIAEQDVLFEGFRVSFETCDCGDGYGCSHGSWPYELLNEFEGVDMSWEYDGFFIESPKGFIRFDKTEEITMYHFVKACELLDLQLNFK